MCYFGGHKLGRHLVGLAIYVLASCVAMATDDPVSVTPGGFRVDSVTGSWVDGEARVRWVTTAESGAAAFRLWRVGAEAEVVIDPDWILVDVLLGGGDAYEVVDPLMRPDEAASYRLEVLLIDGRTAWWGPWLVVFGPPPVTRSVAAASGIEGASITVLSGPSSGPAIKVPVRKHDLYRVSFAAIAEGLGLTVGEVATMAAEGGLAMRHGLEPMAYGVDEAAAEIWFYGWPVKNRHTRENMFWIEPGQGQHIEVRAPEANPLAENPTQYATRYYREDAGTTVNMGTIPDDFYYWKVFRGNSAALREHEFEVVLDDYAFGDVVFSVRLEGFNSTIHSPDHVAEIYVNDLFLGGFVFNENDVVHAVVTNPATNVIAGVNQLKIREANTVHNLSLFLLKEFEVSYQRYFAPTLDAVVAGETSHMNLSADWYVDPFVLDVTNPYRPVRVATPSGTIPNGYRWSIAEDSRWLMRERSARPLASPVVGGFGQWLRDATNRLDYVIITPRAFELPAQAHATYRAGMGLRSAVAMYEDICDWFAGGLSTPEAIQHFLRYAHAHWAVAPKMVVLAGWGHFDYLGVLTTAPNLLPPLLGSDSQFLRPSDLRFADLNDNEMADIAVGRLPVQSATQYNAYLNKLIAYESNGTIPEHNRAFFAADNADGAGNFDETNDRMAQVAQAQYTTSSASLDANSTIAVRTFITNALQSGYGVLHYTGHGSVRQLADENLLSADNVNTMPAHPPVPTFISLTCLIGRYDDYRPQWRSLGEVLVLKPDGGAMAVYAPSGLSWNNHAEQFGARFYQKHADGGYDTLGLALLATAQSLGPPQGFATIARRTYNLLGDPALKLRGGERGVVPADIDQFALWRWEKFTPEELANPEISGWNADPDGTGVNNFTAYAFNNEPPLLTPVPIEIGDNRWAVEWSERLQATDITYDLLWTDSLAGSWQVTPAGEMKRAVAPDGSLVRARVEVESDTAPRYFRLKATASSEVTP